MRELTQNEAHTVAGAILDRIREPMHDPGDYMRPFAAATTSLPLITVPIPRIPGPGHGDDGGDLTHPGGGQGDGGSSPGGHGFTCDDKGCNPY